MSQNAGSNFLRKEKREVQNWIRLSQEQSNLIFVGNFSLVSNLSGDFLIRAVEADLYANCRSALSFVFRFLNKLSIVRKRLQQVFVSVILENKT